MNNTASVATTLQNMQHHVAGIPRQASPATPFAKGEMLTSRQNNSPRYAEVQRHVAAKATSRKNSPLTKGVPSLLAKAGYPNHATPHVSPRWLPFCKYIKFWQILILTIILTMAAHAQTPVSTLAELQTAITNAADGETIEITSDITVNELITIPDGTNITLKGDVSTRTLTRSVNGSLITVASGGSLSLQDITIDGNKSAYSGLLIYLSGSLIMNSGAVLQNNTVEGSGGGVWIVGGTFTMNGGEIKNNNAVMGGGGVFVDGTFTMNGGEISGNNARVGGGVAVNSSGTFTVGGTSKITGNIATNQGNDVHISSNKYITLGTPASGMEIGVSTAKASGVIVESGATVEDAKYFFADEAGKIVVGDGAGLKIVADEDVRTISYDANGGSGTMSSNKVAEGSDYTVKPNAFTQTGYTFTVWNTEPDGSGIDHEEGEEFSNVTADITLYAQWVEVTSSSSSEATPSSSSEEPSSSSENPSSSSSEDGKTPIRLPQITTAPISVHATSNAIVLRNLPGNAKVEVYNLRGQRIYASLGMGEKIFAPTAIPIQTEGIYIVKISFGSERQILRIAVK